MPNKLVVVLAVAGAVLAGCSTAPRDDRPVVSIAPAAQPSAAVPVGDFLPTAGDLAAVLGTGPEGIMGPVVQGGADVLLRTVGDAQVAPADCVSAAYQLQQVAYGSSPVLSVASNSWAGGGFDAAPVSVSAGVVQLGSSAAAQDHFAAATDRWRRCNGQTVTRQRPGSGAGELSRVTDVVYGDRLVSATVLRVAGGAGTPPGLRAIGVAGDCIVEVEVVDPRPGGDPASATAVTTLILDKITG